MSKRKTLPSEPVGNSIDAVFTRVEAALFKTRPKNYEEWYRTTIPSGWRMYRHFSYISSLIDGLMNGEYEKLMINMPPRHGKTETTTIRFPLYYQLFHPGENALITGYNQEFADRLSAKCRTIAVSLGMADGNQRVSEWAVNGGGEILARGVGSPPTGIGFKVIAIDDPIKSKSEAESAIMRDSVWEWYQGDIVQRRHPGTLCLYTGTRWHGDDLSARIVASEGKVEDGGTWKVVNLPAIAEENDPMGREPGEALWPEERPIGFLQDQAVAMGGIGGYSFQTTFQGNPTTKEGGLFLPGEFRYCKPEDVPVGIRKVRRWDLAATLQGDFTVGALMAGPDSTGQYYVMDITRFREPIHIRNNKIKAIAWIDGLDVLQVGPIDPNSAGIESGRAFQNMLLGLRVKMVKDTTAQSKVLKAEPFANAVNVGKVTLVSGAWNFDYVSEVRGFPYAKYDDQVDATSGGFSELFRRESQGTMKSSCGFVPLKDTAKYFGID